MASKLANSSRRNDRPTRRARRCYPSVLLPPTWLTPNWKVKRRNRLSAAHLSRDGSGRFLFAVPQRGEDHLDHHSPLERITIRTRAQRQGQGERGIADGLQRRHISPRIGPHPESNGPLRHDGQHNRESRQLGSSSAASSSLSSSPSTTVSGTSGKPHSRRFFRSPYHPRPPSPSRT